MEWELVIGCWWEEKPARQCLCAISEVSAQLWVHSNWRELCASSELWEKKSKTLITGGELAGFAGVETVAL